MKAEHIIALEESVPKFIFTKHKSGWTIQYERTKSGGWANVLGGGIWFNAQKDIKEYGSKHFPKCIYKKIILDEYINEHIDEFI